jgi:hypothetical protein
MRSPAWSIPAILLVAGAAAEAASGVATGAPTESARAAAHSWAEGDVDGVLGALATGPRTREAELNAAVARLYSGHAAEAATVLARLRERHRDWTPALRWRARAEAQLGWPGAADTAQALLSRPDADVLDRLWAGQLLQRLDREPQARAAFQEVRRWNDGVPIEWQRAAPELAAGLARHRAPALRQLLLASGLPAGERLRFKVKYLFFRLATATLETGGLAPWNGERARRVAFTAKSGGTRLFRIDSRFESMVAADGTVLAHRHVANDSDNGADEAGYDMDRRNGRCTVRTARDGLLSYHVLPLPENAQDGVSILLAARALARSRGSAVLPTAVDGLWWPTELRTLGIQTVEWHGRKRSAVHMQSTASYRGAGGLSGTVDIWISDDERALPYRVKMKVAVGSVVLELLPDDQVLARGAGGTR